MKFIPSIRPEINHKKNKDKLYAVFIRITLNRKMKRLPTGIYLSKATDFNLNGSFGKWVRTSELENKKYNDMLVSLVNRFRDSVFEFMKTNEHPTLEEVYEHLTRVQTKSLLEYHDSEIKRYKGVGKYKYSEKQRFVRKKLLDYISTKLSKQDLTFNELTPAFLKKYELYLIQDLKNDPNTVFSDFRCLRTIFNSAIRDEILEADKTPFKKFPLHDTPKPIEKLYEDEIKAIEKLEYPEGTKLWHIKNYFLFAYYCAGIRFGDFCNLKWGNITDKGTIKYIMSKNNKEFEIILQKKPLAILKLYEPRGPDENYIFPILESGKDYSVTEVLEKKVSSNNAMVNVALKKLALKAGIKKNVSFHIARHSFAYIAYEKTKNLVWVQSLLMHSNLKDTQTYLTELGHTNLNHAMQIIFDV